MVHQIGWWIDQQLFEKLFLMESFLKFSNLPHPFVQKKEKITRDVGFLCLPRDILKVRFT